MADNRNNINNNDDNGGGSSSGNTNDNRNNIITSNRTPDEILAPYRLPPAIVCFGCKWPTELLTSDVPHILYALPCQNPLCQFFVVRLALPMPGEPLQEYVSLAEIEKR